MYKLRTATIGLVEDHGKRVVIRMPTDALLQIMREDRADGTVEVLWAGRQVSMFAIDLKRRGELVRKGSERTVLPAESTVHNPRPDDIEKSS